MVVGLFGHWSSHITSLCLLQIFLSLYFLLPCGLMDWCSCHINQFLLLILRLGLPWPTDLVFHLFWAYWPVFLPCQPVLPLHSSGFLSPFTASLPLFTPMGLLLNSSEFLDPFTTSLPLIPLLGLLAFKLAHWFYQFIPWASSAHLLLL